MFAAAEQPQKMYETNVNERRKKHFILSKKMHETNVTARRLKHFFAVEIITKVSLGRKNETTNYMEITSSKETPLDATS